MKHFNSFIEKLTARLKEPLPGRVAHEKMASESRLKFKMPSPNERTRESAVLILFYPSENQIFLPLILRPEYDGVHGGQMAFPGGRAEKEDENLIRTAMREAQEEIGVRLTDVKVLGQLTKLFIPPSNFYVQPVIGYINHKPDFYPDPREVDKVVEIPLSEITNPQIISRKTLNVRGVEVDAPFYNIQEHTVWGATAMMISELLIIIEATK
ncbi:NUDIX domain-containing protein [Arcicella aurantiaca]|uniref:NUDIX domain-containing protein n=1 Tax=Arcicella aurantiaca TaxID=591202 RepID=A0A316EB99_9BACT|nr:CoA pyrophosphatase [Arcicella aurantiaca]PWK26599.1 NUDIX domain-containing protein [Arcicella aurantiaca]